MFSAKMVCLIQKLFGRDEDSATNDPDLVSRLEIDYTAAATHRPQQSVQPVHDLCAQSNFPNRRSTADLTPSESKNASSQSHHRSQSVSIPACRGIAEISGPTSCLAFANQDGSSASKLPSTYSSSLSWSLPYSSEDRLACSQPVFCHDTTSSAEPVCCCESCTCILESTLLFTAHDRVIGYTQPVLPLSGFVPTVSSYPSDSSLTSCVKSEYSLTSSADVRQFNYENTPHRTNQQQQQPHVLSLPPMISISPDGEEGFANSQRILQQHGRRYKPFCEVPPNKTICHVHWKSINSK